MYLGGNRRWVLLITMYQRGMTSRTFDSWTQSCSSPSISIGAGKRAPSTSPENFQESIWCRLFDYSEDYRTIWHASVYAFQPCIIMYTSNITTYWDQARNKMAVLSVMKQKNVYHHMSVFFFSNSTKQLFWINDRIINNTESVRLVTLGCKRPLRPMKEIIADVLSLPLVGGLPVSFLLVISFLPIICW